MRRNTRLYASSSSSSLTENYVPQEPPTRLKGKPGNIHQKSTIQSLHRFLKAFSSKRNVDNPGRISLDALPATNRSRQELRRYQLALFVAGISTCIAAATFSLLSMYPCLYLCSMTVYDEPKPLPHRSYQERLAFVEQYVRKDRRYLPMQPVDSGNARDEWYDVFDCPMEPPHGYPREFPIMDVLDHWPITDTDTTKDMRYIHQGLCVFDFARHGAARVREQIHAYQRAEKPFFVKNDPEALKTTERWNTDDYLHHKLQRKVYKGEFSKSFSMMYWKVTSSHQVPKGFRPPTNLRPTTFEKWYKRAVEMDNDQLDGDEEKSYLRLDGCVSPSERCEASHRNWGALDSGAYIFTRLDDADFLHDDLPFFSPRYYDQGVSKDYLIEPDKARGIQCRFGAKGLVAEDHFDNERNFISVLAGERRYILGHPNNCKDMSLYPMAHPLERHSQVNWNDPDLAQFPNFENVHVNEVVLQAGDILYLPTYWFHHIVSLNMNYQCNARSGHSLDYDQTIYDCGFLYPWPS